MGPAVCWGGRQYDGLPVAVFGFDSVVRQRQIQLTADFWRLIWDQLISKRRIVALLFQEFLEYSIIKL